MKDAVQAAFIAVTACLAVGIIWRWYPASDRPHRAAPSRITDASASDEQVDDRLYPRERSLRSREGWSPEDFFLEPNEIQAGHAIAGRDQSQLQQLLDRGLDPDTAGYHGMTLLFWSFACGNLDAFRLLLDSGADVDETLFAGIPTETDAFAPYDPFAPGDSILFSSLRLRKVQFFFAALPYTRDVRQVDGFGDTLLHASCSTDRITEEHLQRIIDSGVDLDAIDRKGRTAAFKAVEWNRIRHGLLLLKAGADPDIPDAAGATLRDRLRLGYASDAHLLTNWLKSQEEAVDVRDTSTEEATQQLFDLISMQPEDIAFRLQKLIDAGADPDRIGRTGETPAMLAIRRYGQFDFALRLLHAGADPGVQRRNLITGRPQRATLIHYVAAARGMSRSFTEQQREEYEALVNWFTERGDSLEQAHNERRTGDHLQDVTSESPNDRP